jgi:hypothetical protein
MVRLVTSIDASYLVSPHPIGTKSVRLACKLIARGSSFNSFLFCYNYALYLLLEVPKIGFKVKILERITR